MKRIIILISLYVLHVSSIAQSSSSANHLILSKEQLRNKIKGGWAGQTIGVTFGGPYEFRFQGTFIGDYQPLLWYDGYLKETMLNNPFHPEVLREDI